MSWGRHGTHGGGSDYVANVCVVDGRPRRRILLVAPFPPRLDGRHGGSRVVAQLCAHLSTRHRLGLLALRAARDGPIDPAIAERCEFVEDVELPVVGASLAARCAHRARLRMALVAGTPTWVAETASVEFAKRLERLAGSWQPDVVQLELRITGQYLAALERCPAPRVLTDHDPSGDETSSLASGLGLRRALEHRAWGRLGRAVMRGVDAVVVFTERDRAAMLALGEDTPVTTIPFGWDVDDPPLDPRGANGHRMVYVGSFLHAPNVDAARRLVDHVLPRVRGELPDAQVALVGSHATPEVRALGAEGVSIHADVESVTPYLSEAAVVVLPIRSGGGMRAKALEALAAGKAVVATRLAVEGLAVRDGEHLVVADTDEELAAALTELLRDPELRARLGAAARRWAEEQLSWEPRIAAYDRLYDSLLAPGTSASS